MTDNNRQRIKWCVNNDIKPLLDTLCDDLDKRADTWVLRHLLTLVEIGGTLVRYATDTSKYD